MPDASVIVDLVRGSEDREQLIGALFGSRDTLHAPHVVDLEVAQALRGAVLRCEMEGARAAQALDDLYDLPLNRYPHEHLLGRIWELRQNLTAYDAAYVSLAEALRAPLLTRDARLARAGGHRARIELI